jgi:hypothetical protein
MEGKTQQQGTANFVSFPSFVWHRTKGSPKRNQQENISGFFKNKKIIFDSKCSEEKGVDVCESRLISAVMYGL